MEYVGEETLVETADGEGGWVETHHFGDDGDGDDGSGQMAELEENVCEMTLGSAKRGDVNAADEDDTHNDMESAVGTTNDDADDGDGDEDDDDEAGDMEEFEESGMLEMVDPCTATIVRSAPVTKTAAASSASKSSDGAVAAALEADGDSVVHTRTYDLHITYDKYYQTPRLWVVGYNEVSGGMKMQIFGLFEMSVVGLLQNRKALSVEEMYEDVSQDHAKKTVTMETHPHLPGPNMASVHPCK